MKSTSPTRKKVDKLSAEIQQLEAQIAEKKEKLASLKEAKLEAENTEIISIIRWIIWIIISSCLVVAAICRRQATRMEPWHLQPGYLRMTRV